MKDETAPLPPSSFCLHASSFPLEDQMRVGLKGLIAAPFTAMHADGSLRLDAVEMQAAALASDGVDGVFICGTTGEGFSLTVDERMQLAQRWRAACAERLTLIVHVGHNCVSDARTLTEHAQGIGAAGI